MSNRSKQKGDRRERQVRDLLRSLGVGGERVPLSGAAGGEFEGDLRLSLPDGTRWTAEVKGRARGEGWKKVEGWLAGNDALFLIKDRSAPLVVLPWLSFCELVGGLNVSAEDAGEGQPGLPGP